jgi:SOS-response transcriptional repressor LexA
VSTAEEDLYAYVWQHERAQHIIRFIRSFTAERGFPPTVRQISAEVGINVSSTHHWLKQLQRAGVVTWDPMSVRTLRLVNRDHLDADVRQPALDRQ